MLFSLVANICLHDKSRYKYREVFSHRNKNIPTLAADKHFPSNSLLICRVFFRPLSENVRVYFIGKGHQSAYSRSHKLIITQNSLIKTFYTWKTQEIFYKPFIKVKIKVKATINHKYLMLIGTENMLTYWKFMVKTTWELGMFPLFSSFDLVRSSF